DAGRAAADEEKLVAEETGTGEAGQLADVRARGCVRVGTAIDHRACYADAVGKHRKPLSQTISQATKTRQPPKRGSKRNLMGGTPVACTSLCRGDRRRFLNV